MSCYLKLTFTKVNSLVNTSIPPSLNEKLLGITLDPELTFQEHINKICNIASKKLNALHHIGSHMR